MVNLPCLSVDIEFFDGLPVPFYETGVVNADSEGQEKLQILILNTGDDPFHFAFWGVHPHFGVVLWGKSKDYYNFHVIKLTKDGRSLQGSLNKTDKVIFACSAKLAMRSMAVIRVCRRDATKISEGLSGLCCMMAWKAGLKRERERIIPGSVVDKSCQSTCSWWPSWDSNASQGIRLYGPRVGPVSPKDGNCTSPRILFPASRPNL